MTGDYIATDPMPVLDDHALYVVDGGRCVCGAHAGTSARYTGRDISGQRVWAVTDQDREEWRREVGYAPVCEVCRVWRLPAVRGTAVCVRHGRVLTASSPLRPPSPRDISS